MHDWIDLRFRHHLGDKVRIGNIAANEAIMLPLFQIGQVAQIARIGQQIEIDDDTRKMTLPLVMNEIAANEPHPASYKDPLHGVASPAILWAASLNERWVPASIHHPFRMP